MFLATYLQRAADARELGIRFVALAPKQFLVGTRIGEAAAAAYGAQVDGAVGRELPSRAGRPRSTPTGVARAILAIRLRRRASRRDAAERDRRGPGTDPMKPTLELAAFTVRDGAAKPRCWPSGQR
jgi:hypothetical protein